MQQWNMNMEKMKALDEAAFNWLEKMPPNTWVRAFSQNFPNVTLLNNDCEVFNNYILDARELPILSMFEMINTQLMTRHYNKQKELANQMEGTFCPKIRKKLSKNAEWENMCFPIPFGQGVFQVKVRDYSHIVDISSKTCDCRRWQLTGVPCSHAIACLRHERIKPESVLAPCYSIEAFNTAYGFNIWPCRDQTQWEKMNGPQVQPPLYEKKVGMPPKSMKKQPHEVQGKNGPKFSKHGVTVHCSYCTEANHNSAGCKLKKMGFTSVEAKALVANTQAQLQAEAEQAAQQAAQTASTNEVAEDQQETNDPINQAIYQELLDGPQTQATTTLLTQMLSQETQTSNVSTAFGALPDNEFIVTNQPVQRPSALTTCSKAGKVAAAKKERHPHLHQGGPELEQTRRSCPLVV